jgi:hypothetical protein
MKINNGKLKFINTGEKVKKQLSIFILLILIILSGCSAEEIISDNRSIVLGNDYTNATRNELLIEDIEYFRNQLPKKHKNAFHEISEEEFNSNIDELISKVDKLTNNQVFVEMNKIIALIGDAHTGINYWDGYSYPLKFYFLKDGIYIIDADKSVDDILYAKVKKINGHDIDDVVNELKTLISHENEYWVRASIPNYLSSPVYMYGLGLIPDEEKTLFEFETLDEKTITKEIRILSYGEHPEYINSNKGRNVYFYNQEDEDYYWYDYLEKDKAVYFKYNVCSNMDDVSFKEFNGEMFNSIKDREINKFIIDLRHNSGGNSMIINPFLSSISDLAAEKPEIKIYVIIGRDTFSSGVMAAIDIAKKVDVTLIGECTGGSPNMYGEVGSIVLPNSKIPIYYSKKYFKLGVKGAVTISPQIEIEPTINDFIENRDIVMDYIINN